MGSILKISAFGILVVLPASGLAEQRADEFVQEKHREQESLRQKRYQKIEGIVEKHTKDQRTSEEVGGKDDSLYIRMLEFHDHDGDGIVDHPTSRSEGAVAKASELETTFDPGSEKRLKIYRYLEAYKGFKTRTSAKTQDVVMRHLRQELQQDKAKQAAIVGEKYAKEVLKNISTEKGYVNPDLAEDALRFLNQQKEEYEKELFNFRRIQRLEEFMAHRRKLAESRLKSAYQVAPKKGSERALGDVAPRLDVSKKSSYEFEAYSAYANPKDRDKNIRQYFTLVKEYQKKHPECLDPQWTCHVNDKGEVVKQHITDTYEAAEQVTQAYEYDVQADLLYRQKGEAFREHLPGELENMSPMERAALTKARAEEQKRLALIRTFLEKKSKFRLEKGKVVKEEIATGKKATEKEVIEAGKPSAFEDARQGNIKLEELKKRRGRAGFKTTDY